MTLPIDDQALAARLQHWLRTQRPAQPALRVTGLTRVFGGASCETWRVRVADGTAPEERLILRRNAVSNLVETRRDIEFHAYRAAQVAGLPVPEMLHLDADGQAMERPAFVMREVPDALSSAVVTDDDPFGPHAAALGRQFYELLGRLARFDLRDAPALDALLAPVDAADAWRVQLDHWAGVIAADALEPQPAAEAALRWLRRHPPPAPARVGLVHGDWRAGNFLHDGQGRLLALLDWELVHRGDPLEDLAWSIDPVWGDRRGRAGKMLPTDEAVARWSAASGLAVDAQALAWWRLFSCVKGLGIWLSAGAEFASGRNGDLILVISSWAFTDAHNRLVLHTLRQQLDAALQAAPAMETAR